MRWAEGRETKREEDAAYPLLGIFNIYMPLIYGEGKENALKRLKKQTRESLEDVLGALVKDNKSHSQEERLDKILEWLSAPDPSTNYPKAFKQRQAATGLWLLESEEFAKWKVDAASRLWL
jgi:hypothetical protein